jgi:hypothetical protein
MYADGIETRVKNRKMKSEDTVKMQWNSKYNVTIRCVSIFLLICLLTSLSLSSENEGQIETTRTAIQEWVENQRIISAEKRDLKLAKEMLNERIDLVQREIESLRGKISVTEESIAEADKKRIEMLEENERLKKASASLEDVLAILEQRTTDILKRLPDPIQDHVKMLSQRLPENPNETKLSVSERFQNVVGILNEVDKFNRDITMNTEVRTLRDGSSVEVTALYVGIAQGYYASADGTIAGVGSATDQGWAWKPANEAAAQISDAIAILKNEQVASFVHLPVEIK